MKKLLLLGFLIFLKSSLLAQSQSPSSFLGYELGSKFTPHYKVVSYFKTVSENHNHIKYINYGKTYENRDLIAVVISSPENIARLEEIKKNNQQLTVFGNSSASTDQPAIVWLSYNVHGNEASSTESAIKMLYTLANPTEQIKNWLKNTIVIIDPCLNPDGRDRYVSYFNSSTSKLTNPNTISREHSEPWPGGRSNHYYFDLNRDWAWQSQIESQSRIKLYNEWMPQVHVDFHEQGYNDPYYFAPAAEPVHADITPWQREFQEIVGKNNAKYFDQNGWLYFTKERFDLLYPAYGDTYPMYNGAIGMTYEQGGGAAAGLAVVMENGEILTLKDRLEHHFTSGLATIETASLNSKRLVTEFKKFFQQPSNRKYKTYVVQAAHEERMAKLISLLDKNQIEYAFGGDKMYSAYSFQSGKQEQVKINRNDLVINLNQRKAMLANVLFEPSTFVSDSNTYDITAWALPFAYNLPAFALTESVKGKYEGLEIKRPNLDFADRAYAWIFNWNSISDSKLLKALFEAGVNVRKADQPFTLSGKEFGPGTLLIYRADNIRLLSSQSGLVSNIFKQYNKVYTPVQTGQVEKGKDLGSNAYRLMSEPKIALASGSEVSSLNMGEIWHFLEEEMNYPISLVNINQIGNLDVNEINILILPNGRYGDQIHEKLLPWIKSGGRLIVFETAIQSFINKKPFEIAKKEITLEKPQPPVDLNYAHLNAENNTNAIPGAIFKLHVDTRNPINLGLGDNYYTLKTNATLYNLLNNGYNSAVLRKDGYVSGVAGSGVMKTLQDGMLIGQESIERGQIIYFGVNPLFRSFWEAGKQMFVNTLWMAD